MMVSFWIIIVVALIFFIVMAIRDYDPNNP